jgi:hypothetical protein
MSRVGRVLQEIPAGRSELVPFPLDGRESILAFPQVLDCLLLDIHPN